MKLKVGLYVKTSALYGGRISKITKLFEDTKTLMLFGTGATLYPFKEITKVRNDIIDLIEKNDFVNGKRVTCKIDKYIYLEDEIRVSSKQIKTIVTKECFESMQYEVK